MSKTYVYIMSIYINNIYLNKLTGLIFFFLLYAVYDILYYVDMVQGILTYTQK